MKEAGGRPAGFCGRPSSVPPPGTPGKAPVMTMKSEWLSDLSSPSSDYAGPLRGRSVPKLHHQDVAIRPGDLQRSGSALARWFTRWVITAICRSVDNQSISAPTSRRVGASFNVQVSTEIREDFGKLSFYLFLNLNSMMVEESINQSEVNVVRIPYCR